MCAYQLSHFIKCQNFLECLILQKTLWLRNTTSFRTCSSHPTTHKILFTQEFSVSPFANLKIDCNFNLALQPLSVNKYINQDRIIINTFCHKTVDAPIINYQQNGDEIAISSSGTSADCLCIVEAPIKANFDIVVDGDGCVSAGSFENDFLKIKTHFGNVEVDKLQSGDVEIVSLFGDVICKRNTQATSILLKTKTGKIKTDKLQGKKLIIETESGDVTTEASYCDSSCFKSKTGNFYLQNVHKTCEIAVEDGYVSLMVFDGKLNLVLKRGKADVLLSRILEDSIVSVEEEGCLNLKIVENCFDSTGFRIETKNLKNSTTFDCIEDDNVVVIKSKLEQENVVNVKCKDVTVEKITVSDLFRLLK